MVVESSFMEVNRERDEREREESRALLGRFRSGCCAARCWSHTRTALVVELHDQLVSDIDGAIRIEHAQLRDLPLRLRLEWRRVLRALRLDLDLRIIDDDELISLSFAEFLRAFAHGAIHRLPLKAALAIRFQFTAERPLFGLQLLKAQRVETLLLLRSCLYRLGYCDG